MDYRRLAELTHTRTEVFNRLPEMVAFLNELPDYDIALYTHKKMKTNSENSLQILQETLPLLEKLTDFSEQSIHDTLAAFIAEKEYKNALVFWPLRIAASGQQSTPGGTIEILYLLGKEESLRRIKNGIARLSQAQAEQENT